jgi:hypothetical protein
MGGGYPHLTRDRQPKDQAGIQDRLVIVGSGHYFDPELVLEEDLQVVEIDGTVTAIGHGDQIDLVVPDKFAVLLSIPLWHLAQAMHE